MLKVMLLAWFNIFLMFSFLNCFKIMDDHFDHALFSTPFLNITESEWHNETSPGFANNECNPHFSV